MKKLTKDQKQRMEMYTVVADALKAQGVEILGKSKKGLVLEGGMVEIAVVIKKEAVTEYDELVTVAEYNAKLKAEKEAKEKEKEDE